MNTTTDQTYSKLRSFNLIMGFMHLVQGVFMWVVSNDTTYPVFTNFLSFDTSTLSLSPQAKLFYEPSDIGSAMLVGVDFPTLGCWKITGKYNDVELSFVIQVVP